MDHRHFEEKLFNDEPLSPEEARAVRQHARACASCAALFEVNLSLHQAAMAAPAPGFANRFMLRLAARRKQQRRRYMIGLSILLFASMAVLLWLLSPLLAQVMEAPFSLLQSWLRFITTALTMAHSFTEVGKVIFRVVGGFIPASAWGFAFSLFGVLGMLWAISLQTVLGRVKAAA